MCSVALDVAPDAPLPREFRIFKEGVNETTHGPYVYDAEAAAAVLADYRRCGVDLMIDLNHSVIDENPRPDSSDARGWFQLEQRGGELWAVNVSWTPDGEQRLREKRQRYISPLFKHTKEGRIQSLLNVALVSMPATHEAAPLVAASKLAGAQRVACYAALCLLLCARNTRSPKRSNGSRTR
jgi:phage I-like protein